jgi:hypothetical protein
MNMRLTLRICGLLLGFVALSVPVARAATVTRVLVSGTTANLNLVVSTPGARPDCTIDFWVTLMASATVQRSDGTASTGAIGFVQRLDNCTDLTEFGSFNAALPASAFASTASTVTVNATIPVAMQSLGPDGAIVNRTLVATGLKFTNVENNSVSSRSFGLTKAPGFTLISRGSTVFNAASVAGTLSMDGRNLITSQAMSTNSIETGTSATIDITK